VGYTEGYSRSNRSYYHHGQVKAVYVYNLCKIAREILCGDLIPYDVSVLKDKRRLETMINFPIRKFIMSDSIFYRPEAKAGHAISPGDSSIDCSLCSALWLQGLSCPR
jgi:hypothetical protein